MVIVLLVALLGLLVFKWSNGSSKVKLTAVYLRTGDLYFGELTSFPSFGLKHPYLFTVNQQDKQNPVNVQKFSNIFWGPEDFIRINRDEVVWTADLKPDSNLVKLVQTNPDLVPPAQPQTGQGNPQNGQGTTPAPTPEVKK